MKKLIEWLILLFLLGIFAFLVITQKTLFLENAQKLKQYLPEIIPQVLETKNQLINTGLKNGSSGDEVEVLQIALSSDEKIYPEAIVSGFYGELTEKAVKKFQTKYGLSETGQIDGSTATKFNEIYGTNDKNYYLSLVPTPEIAQIDINNQAALPDIEEWGQAKQVSEHSWSMKIGLDARMATPQEIFEALNNYRQKHGRNQLAWDDRLATYAQERAAYFTQLGDLDEHKGFSDYVNNEDNLKKLGFWWVGENSSYGYRLEGVHLIEWIYAGDKPHNDNQLNPDWTHVGIGVDGNQSDIIFAAKPI